MSTAESTHQPTASALPARPNFPFTWENPEDEGLFWTLDRMHTPDPITPMDELFIGYVWQGVSTVAQIYDIPIRTRTRRINTYLYVTILPAVPPKDGVEAQSQRSEEKLRAVFARIGDLWKSDLFPEVKQYLVHKASWNVVERQVGDKRRMSVPVSQGTEEVDVPRSLRSRPALEDSQVVELARLAVALESTMGWPVDLECSYHAGKLYLLQCRPVTTIGMG